jgi:glutaredoxin-like protein NrdH
MATKIIMFTKKDCPNCMRAKMLFEDCPVEVELIEKNIETDPDAYLEFVALGSNSAPTFKFEDGGIVPGFDEGKIMNKLGL